MTSTPATDPTPTPAVYAPPRTLSILSLVAGIASIPFGHFFLLPIAAIVLGFFARSREPYARTMSTWGIVLGFVVLFGWLAVGLFALAFVAPLLILHSIH
jgi:hypothetical protein